MQIKYAEKYFANKNSQMHSGNNAKHILKMKKKLQYALRK